jgi:two-component system, OmpR family, alkaline phosphatase synthesis response regulator PhoP
MNNETIRILLADYDENAMNFYCRILEKSGYQVGKASNGSEVKNKAILFRPHLFLIDLMNIEFSCFKVVSQLRANPMFFNSIIIIFTSMYDEASQNVGLITQANGFIRKNTDEELFLAYLRKYIKASNLDFSNRKMLEFPDLLIDVEGYMVRKGTEVIDLAKREFELLLFLASEPQKIFTRFEISNQMWGHQDAENNRILDVYISKLRNKIGKNHIQTMKGVGYTFVS